MKEIPGHMRIEGKVEIHLPPGVKEENATTKKKDNSRETIKIYLEGLTLLFVIIYAGLTFWLGCLTHQLVSISQDTFNAANRPYIGINGISVLYLPRDVTNAGQLSQMPTGETTRLAFKVEIKNIGPVPGTNETQGWRVFIDGIEQLMTKVTSSPVTFFPGELTYLSATIDERDYSAIQSGTKKLVIDVWVDYDGPAGHYKDCERQQYEPGIRAFYDLGARCAPKAN
jgi:hypothetical protein